MRVRWSVSLVGVHIHGRNAHFARWAGLAVLACIGTWLGGCSADRSDSGDAPPAKKSAPAAAASPDDKPLLEPFTPPSLKELDAKAEWVDQPVQDGIELLRAEQAKHKPPLSVAEALALKNESDRANKNILDTLGRLPENDAEVNWDATFNHHTPADVKTTNPIMVSTVSEFELQSLISAGLFSFDWNMRPFGAKESILSWQTSKDHLYDKVVMRKDLTWSDGRPFTAHDVAFSFRTIMDKRVPVPAARSGTDKLRWVEAYDDHTLVFFHKESLPTNVWNVLFPVIPKHIYEHSINEDPTLQDSPYHVKYENAPVCSGPYTVARRARGQEIVLARRKSWYMYAGKQVRQKPYFNSMRIRIIEDPNTALLALKAGEIDDMILNPEQWRTQASADDFYRRNTKASGPEWTYFFFGWNLKNPLFSDLRVRKALAYAFDYDEMLNRLFYGLYEPCNGIFNPDSWMAPKPAPPYYHQDRAKAEQLLEEAGWVDHDGDGVRDKEIDGQGVPFEFTIVCPNIPERIAICRLLKESLDAIGITCNIRPLEFTVLQQQMIEHNFQAAFGGWGTGTDPDTSENVWGTGQMRNFLNYSNAEVDKLFLQGRAEFNRQKRAEIYGRIAHLIYADQPSTFLYYRNAFYGFSKQARGYKFSPRGPYTYNPGFLSLWKPK